MTGWGNLLLGHPLAEQRSVFQGGSRAACVSVPSPVQPFLLDHCMDLLDPLLGLKGSWAFLKPGAQGGLRPLVELCVEPAGLCGRLGAELELRRSGSSLGPSQ